MLPNGVSQGAISGVIVTIMDIGELPDWYNNYISFVCIYVSTPTVDAFAEISISYVL